MVGSTLSHYRILEELGRGGMGIVYKAEDTKLDRTVAIKVLPSAALASEDDRVRFYREAKAAAKLHHPHIASVFEIDEAAPSDAPHGTEPSPFIAMEFIDGEALSSVIAKGPMKLEESIRIASQIGQALEAAHEEGIVHRDIKAQNVMLTKKGDAKVLDFGLALTAQSTKLTRMGSTLGTVAYMSPEQARGEEVDARTDIWALGVTLYEMIAGTHPFGGDYEQAVLYSILNEDPEPLTAIRTGVPMELERIVAKATFKDKKARFRSVSDFVSDLKNIALITSRLETPSGRISVSRIAAPMPSSRLNSLGWVVAVVVLVGAVISLWTLQPSGHEPGVLKKTPIHIANFTGAVWPAISEDGSAVYMRGRRNDVYGIYRFDLFSGMLDLVSEVQPWDGQGYPFVIHPEGHSMAYENVDELSIMPLPTGRSTVLSDSLFVMTWLDSNSLLLWHDRQLYKGILKDQQITEMTLLEGIVNPDDANIVVIGQLAEGRFMIYGLEYYDGTPSQLYVYDWPNETSSLLVNEGINGFFIADDVIAYQNREGEQMFGQMFDKASLQPEGEPVLLADQLAYFNYAMSHSGRLVEIESVALTIGADIVDKRTAAVSSTIIAQDYFRDISSFNPETRQFAGIVTQDGSLANQSIFVLNLSPAFGVGSSEFSPVMIVDSSPGIKGKPHFMNRGADLSYRIIEGTQGIWMESSLEQGMTPELSETNADILRKAVSKSGRYTLVRQETSPGTTGLVLIDNSSGDESIILDQTADIVFDPFSRDENFALVAVDEGRAVVDLSSSEIVFLDPESDIRSWSNSRDYLLGIDSESSFRIPYRSSGGFEVTGGKEEIHGKGSADGAGIIVDTDTEYIILNNTQMKDYTVLWLWENVDDYVRSQN